MRFGSIQRRGRFTDRGAGDVKLGVRADDVERVVLDGDGVDDERRLVVRADGDADDDAQPW
jgi:hypothetical protein